MTITSAAAIASTTRRRARPARSRRTGSRGPRAPWCRWTKYSWKSSQPSSTRTSVRTGSSAIGRIAVGMPRRVLQRADRCRSASGPRGSVRSVRCGSRSRGRRGGTRPLRRTRRGRPSRSRSRPRAPSRARGRSGPASMYMTASWSGMTSRPCRSVSSPVLTMTVRSPSGRTACRPWASFAPPVPPARATTFTRSAPSRSSPTRGMRSIVSRSYGAGIRTMTVSKPSSVYGRMRVGHLGRATRAEWRHLHRIEAVVGHQRPVARPRPRRGSSRRTIGKLTSSRSSRCRARRRRSARRGWRLVAHVLDGPLVFQPSARNATVRSVLLRAGPADEDRQVRLDRPRRGQRVVERVEPALVAEPLAVEQAADQHHRPRRSDRGVRRSAREVDAVGVMLALEPGAADAQDRPAVREVVEGRRRAWRRGPGCGTCWRRPSGRGGPGEVSGASPASTLQPSKIGCSQGPKIASRWSHVQTESQPASSAARAASRKPGQSVSLRPELEPEARHEPRGGRGRRRAGTGS